MMPTTPAEPITPEERTSFVHSIIQDLRSSRKDTDRMTVSKWFEGRNGIDVETRREVLTTMFPYPRRAPKPKAQDRYCTIVNMMHADNVVSLLPEDLGIWLRVHSTASSDAVGIIVEMHRRNMIKGEAQ